VVEGEVAPCVAVGGVVLADRAPLAGRDVGPPQPPRVTGAGGGGKAIVFLGHGSIVPSDEVLLIHSAVLRPIAPAVLTPFPNCARRTFRRVVYHPHDRSAPAGSFCVRSWGRERAARGPQDRPAYALVATDTTVIPNCGRPIVLRTQLGIGPSERIPAGSSCERTWERGPAPGDDRRPQLRAPDRPAYAVGNEGQPPETGRIVVRVREGALPGGGRAAGRRSTLVPEHENETSDSRVCRAAVGPGET